LSKKTGEDGRINRRSETQCRSHSAALRCAVTVIRASCVVISVSCRSGNCLMHQLVLCVSSDHRLSLASPALIDLTEDLFQPLALCTSLLEIAVQHRLCFTLYSKYVK